MPSSVNDLGPFRGVTCTARCTTRARKRDRHASCYTCSRWPSSGTLRRDNPCDGIRRFPQKRRVPPLLTRGVVRGRCGPSRTTSPRCWRCRSEGREVGGFSILISALPAMPTVSTCRTALSNRSNSVWPGTLGPGVVSFIHPMKFLLASA